MNLRSGAVLLAFVVNTVLTFMSQTGVYGHTNAELSRKYQSLATPAGWAFAIWGIIFTLETCFAIAQCFPSVAKFEEVQKLGPWFAAACLFQAGWSVAFGFERIYLAQALILLILASLWRTSESLRSVAAAAPPSWGRYFLCYLPFTVHFGWLTAASVVSINLTLVSALPSAHTLLLAVSVASLTAVLLPVLLLPSSSPAGSDGGFGLTVAWALGGVSAQLKQPLDKAPTADPITDWCPPFVTSALSLVAAGLAVVAVVSVAARAVHSAARRSSTESSLSDALMAAKP